MRMHVVVMAATKGGVGKSTLAAAFAVAAFEEGAKVALIDLDPQDSVTDWHELRGSPENPRLLAGDSLAASLATARGGGVEWVFVDTPPAILNIIEPAVRQADLVVIPVRPSPLDILAIDPIVTLCEEHKRACVFLLNQVPPRTAFAEEAAKQLKKDGKVLGVSIASRNSFAMAMTTGKTAPEVERGDGKAREEIAAAWAAIKRLLKVK